MIADHIENVDSIDYINIIEDDKIDIIDIIDSMIMITLFLASIISSMTSSIVPMVLFMHLMSYNPYFIHNHTDSINDIGTMIVILFPLITLSIIIDGNGI